MDLAVHRALCVEDMATFPALAILAYILVGQTTEHPGTLRTLAKKCMEPGVRGRKQLTLAKLGGQMRAGCSG